MTTSGVRPGGVNIVLHESGPAVVRMLDGSSRGWQPEPVAEHQESVQTRELLQQATDLVVLAGDADYKPGRRKDNKTLGRSRSPEVLAAAASAVAFTDGERMDWMTLGSPTLVFLNGRKVLASIRCLLPGFLRCEALWEGDVPLLDKSAVPKLLRVLAVDPARARLDDGQSPVEVARFVRERFALSPAWTYRVLRDAGLTYLASKKAVDRTLTDADARATEAARTSAVEALEDPNW